MEYKDDIFFMIENVSDERVLEYLYNFIKFFIERYTKKN